MLRLRLCIGLLVLLMDFPILLLAQTGTTSFGFIENRGQWPREVLFRADPAPNVAVFIERDGIRVNIIRPEDVKHSHVHHQTDSCAAHDDGIVHGHAYKMTFTGINKDRQVVSTGPSADYLNYFSGRDQASWISKVKRYRQIIFTNLYPSIDLLIGEVKGNLKLEWRIRRGGKPESIGIRYDGLDQITISDGRLSLFTSAGEVSEGYPESWTWVEGKKRPVSCDYQKTGKDVGYSLPSLPASFDTLVIDPELIFSTYSGSAVDNWGFTATYDNQGNVFSGGIASGAGYPVTTGAWQQVYAGGWDIAIIKYDSTGTIRRWATYLGGNKADLPHSIICDEAGNLFIFGTTGSANFPVTAGAWDESFNGGTPVTYDDVLPFPQGVDIFIAKLNADGTELLGGTYIGGTGNDGLNYRTRYSPVVMTGNDTLYYNYGDGARGEIAIDQQNYIYIGSCTFSTDYPVTSGVFQTQQRGKQEGVITKISPTLNNIVWSSYVGGSGDDAIYSIDVTPGGNVLASGGTTSTNLLTTPGAPKPTFQGGTCDGFLLKTAPSGQALQALTYFGSNKYDQAYFIRADRLNNVYIYGQTAATGNTLIQNAPYANPNSGQFLAKFNPLVTTMLWSTVFGSGRTGPDISPTAFSVDVCNRIYVSGWGRHFGGTTGYSWGSMFGTKGMPITTDAWQNQTDGQDFYIGVFDEEMTGLEYGTFFGELHYSSCSYSGHDHVDGGTSRFDRNGNIYQSVCASCGACQQFPTFPNPGAWSNTNNSSNCNNAVFKINLITDFALAAFNAVAPGCTPYTVHFQNTSRGTAWLWNFDDPSSGSANTSTLKNPVHTFAQAGTYDVRLIVQWPTSCNLADTLIRSVTVLSNTVYQIDTVTSCNGEPVQIGIAPSPDPSIVYQWTPATALSDPNVSNPTAKPAAPTLYLLVAGNGICSDSIFQMVMADQVWIMAPSDTAICDTSATLTAGCAPGCSLLWSSSPAFADTLNNYPAGTSIQFSGQGAYTFYLKAESANGCIAIDSVVAILSKPDVEISGEPEICLGDSVWFSAVNPEAGYHYFWKSSSAILAGQGTPGALIRPAASGYIAVKATDTLSGCSDTAIFFFEVNQFEIRLQTTPTTCYDTCDGTATLLVTGGAPPYVINWVNGQSGFTATSLCSGTQWAKITDSEGCDSVFVFSVPSPPEILTNDTSAGVSCPGMTDGFITLNTSGGVPPFTWLWSNGASTESVSGLSPGLYTVAITDASGCRITKSWTISEPEPLAATASTINIACRGDSTGAIALQISGGTAPFTALWNTGATGLTVTNLPAGFYTALITDSRGCQLGYDTVLTEPESVLLVNPTLVPPTCFNSADGSIGLEVTGGVPPYLFVWNNGTTTSFNNNLAAGNHGVTITDGANCVKPYTFFLLSPDSMVIGATLSPPSCFSGVNDGSIQLQVSGGTLPLSIKWSNGQEGAAIFGLPAGLFTASVTDSNGCRQQHAVNLIPPPALSIAATTVSPSCFGDADGTISAVGSGGTAPFRYQWSTGSLLSTINGLQQGNYQLTLFDSKNCRADTAIILTEPAELTVTKTITPPECRGASNGMVKLTPAGGTPPYLILWDDATEGSQRTGLIAGQYRFVLTDSHDCEVADSVLLPKVDCELIIPNVITPNNDGFNDFFEIPNIEYYPDNELFIHNRWGREIRHYDSYHNQWDGRDESGTTVADGTYYYILILRNVKQYQGVITVLR